MRKTIRFMDWWMNQTQALKFCSRNTYRLIWDRCMKEAEQSLTRDIQIHQNRINLLKEMRSDVHCFAREENPEDSDRLKMMKKGGFYK